MRLFCAAAVVALAASWAMAADFSGTYVGNKGQLAVELKADGDAYAGSIHWGADTFPCKASVKDGALDGSFTTKDGSFAFTASLDGKVLTFKTGKKTYNLDRQGAGANPLDADPAPAPASLPAHNDQPQKLTAVKTYKHATGGTFGYPAEWTVKETDQGLQLIPPNPARNAQGPTEAYFIVAESAGGMKQVDDPQAVRALEAYVAKQAPALKRVGEVESLPAGAHKGIGLTWEVSANGMDVRARLYATIIKDNAVFLMALGEKQAVISREPALKDIFATFGFTEARIEKELVGTWYYWSYKGSASGNISAETRRTAELREDGTFVITGNVDSYISATVKDSGGDETAHGSVAGQHSSAVNGRWSAGDGRLYLAFDGGGLISFKYQFKDQNGNRWMLLDNGAGKPEEWSRNKL